MSADKTEATRLAFNRWCQDNGHGTLDDMLSPLDRSLRELMWSAWQAARQWPDGEPVGPIYCVGNKVSHAYFWRRSDAEAFASTAAPSIGLHVWEVPVMGKPTDSAARIAELHATLKVAGEALSAMLTHMGMDEDEWNKPTFDQARAALRQIKEAQHG